MHGFVAALLAALVVAAPSLLVAAERVSAEPSPAERAAAEAQRKTLLERIDAIRRDITSAEKDRAAAADALKESEQAISDITRRLTEIEQRRKAAATELTQLEGQIQQLDVTLQRREEGLAELLRRQYATGAGSPWSALLSGDDPHETGRTLGYLSYVSRARAEAVQELRIERKRLQELKTAAANRRTELETLAAEQATQRDERVRQQAERQRVLGEIGTRLAVQRKEASRLEDDETRLSTLIVELNRALAEQAAARKRAEEQARRERELALQRAREVAAERQAAAQRQAAEQAAAEQARALVAARSVQSTPAPSTPLPASEPASSISPSSSQASDPYGLRPDEMTASGVRSRLQLRATEEKQAEVTSELTRDELAASSPASATRGPTGSLQPTSPEPAAPAQMVARINTPQTASAQALARIEPQPAAPSGRRESAAQAAPANFAALQGRLRLPVRGNIVGRFGAQRPEGGTWRGVFIQAAAAAPVQAVAPGAVVFSGWMRGFGNLVILDHGNDYLTVYANNEAILKQVGDNVAAGETVASVGSSGGQAQTGIYFEVRHRGNPVDPLKWAQAR